MTGSAIIERLESGAGRRPLTLPVRATYDLRELVPRRPSSDLLAYTLPGEMGEPLARAFERTFALVERGYPSGLAVGAPSRLLTPRWARVVGRLVHHGLARTIQLSWPLEHGVPLYYFDIGSPFHEHLTDGGRPELPRFSRGFSEDYDLALSKVVGECLERAPLTYFRMRDMVRSSPRALRRGRIPFVEPRVLAVFSEEQLERRPEARWNDDSVFQWTSCTSLVTGKESLVPAQLVHWNYPIAWGDVPEPMLRECSSHGAGGFFSVEGAILSGALECVQRDAFFLHWLRRVVPPRIDTSTIRRPATEKLVREARSVGLEPIFLDITSDLGIPTCLCVLRRDDGEMPHACMGASTRLDGESAIHDALLEAASVHHIVACDTTRVRVADDYEPFADPTFSTNKRLAFWANPEHARHLDFFLAGRQISVAELSRGLPAPRDAREGLTIVTDVLRSRGFDAWYFQATHAALTELGYASVRVIVPGLIPLYYEERNAPLGVPRLRRSPIVANAPEGPFTPWPHPFP
jgi:ribosomal protein S12 methylthiotransferase accessory factor